MATLLVSVAILALVAIGLGADTAIKLAGAPPIDVAVFRTAGWYAVLGTGSLAMLVWSARAPRRAAARPRSA